MADFKSLISRAQSGDMKALEELVRKFDPLLNRCARSADPQIRDDLKQELAIKLIQLIRKYKVEGERSGSDISD